MINKKILTTQSFLLMVTWACLFNMVRSNQ